jgi:hypothetical protein
MITDISSVRLSCEAAVPTAYQSASAGTSRMSIPSHARLQTYIPAEYCEHRIHLTKCPLRTRFFVHDTIVVQHKSVGNGGLDGWHRHDTGRGSRAELRYFQFCAHLLVLLLEASLVSFMGKGCGALLPAVPKLGSYLMPNSQ